MVSVYQSINDIKKVVYECIRRDTKEILSNSVPPCFKEFNNCKNSCYVFDECKNNTVIVDEKSLRSFGL